jgi:hypothetical protein
MRAASFVLALSLFAACGTIKVVDDAQSGVDTQGADVGDAGSADTGTVDTGKADTSGIDPALACENEFDCQSVKLTGVTPCKEKRCVNVETGKPCDGTGKCPGMCQYVLRPVGTKCEDTLKPATECETTTCDEAGTCKHDNKPEGEKCGMTNCGNLCKAGVCTPATSADYDDKNPCTIDACNQGQEVTHTADVGAACDDSNPCTQDDVCQKDGSCGGKLKSCNDGVACTVDACDKGTCTHEAVNKNCDDSNPCTKDACNASKGCVVTGVNVTAPCDDGNGCTQNDICVQGPDGSAQCKAGSSNACDCGSDNDCAAIVGADPTKAMSPCVGKYACDLTQKKCVTAPKSALVCDTSKDNPCLKTTCDAIAGCVQTIKPDAAACEDGNVCTTGAKCQGGNCVVPANSCDDGNPCTIDSCNSKTGCQHFPIDATCDDGNPCSVNDACSNGNCKGLPKNCDDNLPCTLDTCDSTKGGACGHLPSDLPCDDGNPCTKDQCKEGVGCAYSPDDSGTCDDNNDCTKDDKCAGGKCAGLMTCECQSDKDCDEGDPCTVNVCNGGKCEPAVAGNDGAACSPADKCLQPLSGKCGGGKCSGGVAKDCGPGDACNTSVCNPSTGSCNPVPKPSGTPCDADKNGCTGPDFCAGGKCLAGAAVTCAADACNTAACTSTGSGTYTCAKTPKGDGLGCDDGNACTQGDTCKTGQCLGGAPVVCAPGTACMSNACDPVKGCTATPVKAGTACNNGLFCVSNTTCDGKGACGGGTPKVCPGVLGQGCSTQVCDELADACRTQYESNCCASTSLACDDTNACTSDTCGKTGFCANFYTPGCTNTVAYLNGFDNGSLKLLSYLNSTNTPDKGWHLITSLPPTPPAGVPQPMSKPGMLHYGSTATWNFDFTPNQPNHGWFTTPPIQMPKGPMELRFALFLATEQGPVYDKLKVDVITEAGVEETVWSKDGNTPINAWTTIKVVLDKYATPSTQSTPTKIRIRVTFDTGDGVANTTPGVFIDDFRVAAPVGAPVG